MTTPLHVVPKYETRKIQYCIANIKYMAKLVLLLGTHMSMNYSGPLLTRSAARTVGFGVKIYE